MGRIIDVNLGSKNSGSSQEQSGSSNSSKPKRTGVVDYNKAGSKQSKAFAIKLPFKKKKKARLLDVPVIGGSSSAAGREKSEEPRAAVTRADRPKRFSAIARANRTRAGEGGGLSPARSTLFSGEGPRITAIVVVVVLATGLIFYTPLQTLYVSHREHAKLLVEEAAVKERENYLESKVDELSTPQGIEAEAASSLGLVTKGEKTAEVEGLESRGDEKDIKVDVVSQDIKAPETWYSPLLDSFFGVE